MVFGKLPKTPATTITNTNSITKTHWSLRVACPNTKSNSNIRITISFTTSISKIAILLAYNF